MNDATAALARTCWVMSDGKAGMEVQGLGLAEALGFDPAVKRIAVRRPWRWLPPPLVPSPLDRLGPGADALEAPWPDVLIACGRQTVALSLAIRRASAERTFTVQIQNPVVDPARFDAVVTPRHDRLSAPNVIETTGGLNRITPARLAEAAARFAPQFNGLPRPRVAVLLGGDNKVYRMTREVVARLGRQLAELSRREGAGLLVTPSRRTSAKAMAILRRTLTGIPAYVWDGRGDNPYLALLALADALVVTADSVNMVSEAATTGKPVFIVELKGGSEKFRRFHRALRDGGVTRPFVGHLETWSYAPLRDTERVAAEIRRRLAERAAEPGAPRSHALSGVG